MADRKTYGEGCLAAHALDLIGDRWALLIARELMLGPKRFGLIRAGLPGIATNMLARRLEEMEAAGLLTHRTLPAPANAPVYELTAHGLGLRPVLLALCQWGVAVPGHDHRLPISPTSLMLSMESMLRPGPGEVLHAGFDMGAEIFSTTLTGAGMHTRRSDRPEGEAVFRGPANAMAIAVYGPAPLAQLVAQGLIGFDGNEALGQAVIDRFRLGPPGDG